LAAASTGSALTTLIWYGISLLSYPFLKRADIIEFLSLNCSYIEELVAIFYGYFERYAGFILRF
jgi:hypothetical protein